MQIIEQNGYSRQEILDALVGITGSRSLSFYYNLLDKNNTFKSVLNNIESGSIETDYDAEIFATAKFSYIEGTEDSINFNSDRIQPVVRIDLPKQTASYEDAINSIPTKIIRYRLDHTSGTTCAEAFRGNTARNGTNGAGMTIGQAPLVIDGGRSIKGSKTATSGTSQITTANSGEWINGLDRITFVLWVSTPTLLTDEIQGLVGFYNTLTSDYGVSISYAEKGTVNTARRNVIRATLNIGSSVLTFESLSYALGAVGTAGHCIVFSWQSGLGARIYVDGQNVYGSGTNEFVTGGLKSSGNIRIGADGISANKAFDGFIDDFALFGQQVDIYAAANIYQAGKKVGKYGSINYAEWKQGVFVLSSPSRAINDGTKVHREVDAYDLNQVLLDDKVASRYFVDIGVKYTTAVIEILSKTVGIYNPTPNVYNDAVANGIHTTLTTSVVLEWPPETPKLNIINDLLTICGYEKIWFDQNGVPQVLPYILPQNRATEYTYKDDARSVMVRPMEQGRDWFHLPNKWVAIVSDPDKPILTASYTNNDPTDPTSVVSRGKTVVEIINEDQAADQATINLHVQQAAVAALSQLETVEFQTGLMPFHQFADYLYLSRSDIGIDSSYIENGWSTDLSAGAVMEHKARKVVNLNPNYVGTL